MWTIFEHKAVAKTLKSAPREIRAAYEAWKRIVELQGPVALKQIRGFNDELLRGDWDGFRSSRLNKQWRVIYEVQGTELIVFVEKVTPHKY